METQKDIPVKTTMPFKTDSNETALLYQTRSEEIQEIMGRMPSWIIRWGITVIGLVVAGLFIGAALASFLSLR